MAAVTIDFVVRPIPLELLDKVVCTHCRTAPARWELETSQGFACSFCFLYALVPADQQPSVEWLTHEVEKAKGVVFARDDGRHLVEEKQADCIAFAIVASNRVFAAQARTP